MGSSLEFFTSWISFYNLTPCRMYFGNCSRHFQTFRLDFPPFWKTFLPLILRYYTFLVFLFLDGLSHLFELIFLYLVFKSLHFSRSSAFLLSLLVPLDKSHLCPGVQLAASCDSQVDSSSLEHCWPPDPFISLFTWYFCTWTPREFFKSNRSTIKFILFLLHLVFI